ncbi:hypothetical protein BIZ83_gp137 [Erwinia phage vB_EamM_ChrisDB]|uniref:hypothetical protein n=1 Tax=Erwinia phage vB_EamM_ChrisDB TaxID=1883371 RepID=UPI00081CA3E1|nr:hypothetical protein BIZ83_gp137 [Erwinia phage vB_EamM_ChrisDB]ANZ48716.1 hypothetical protein CHRISDB_154 [Erwinia phage vB_EamM_ChrisDB]
MRNLFTKTNAVPVAPATKTVAKKNEDMLDILLKLSHTEREAVMKTIKEGNKMVDELEVIYGKKDKPKSSGLVWVC